MAKETRDSRTATTPTRFAETTPPQSFPSGDYTYILAIVMNMQVSMGKLMEAVESLKEQAKDNRSKLERLSHILYATGVVGTVLLAIGVWLLNKISDVVISHLTLPK